MSTSPPPSVARGDITLQPSYFTSSLFVNPLREDIALLVQVFAQTYLRPIQDAAGQPGEDVIMQENTEPAVLLEAENASSNAPLNVANQPFAFFKQLWKETGWVWFHFKVFDGRARESFIHVVLRCFSEYFVESVNPLAQTVALFGMYTFFMIQPTATGPSLHSVKHIPLPLDIYKTLLALPEHLSPLHLLPLQPYATQLLRTLLSSQAFHILPDSSLRAQNPSELPREFFVEDSAEAPSDGTAAKKKGRPSKRDKARKAKDAVTALDKWLDKNTYTYPEPTNEAGASAATVSPPRTTHTLISHPPSASRAIYTIEKTHLLNIIDPPAAHGQMVPETISPGAISASSRAPALAMDTGRGPLITDAHGPLEREALARANDAVLARLKKIDEMAAERGLEVGGEGGEKTGLARVERAVRDFQEGKSSGILSLLEGAGARDEAA